MYRVIVADDSAFMRTLIRRTLEPHGFAVVGEAPNGEDCIALYRALRPDLVTLDNTMHGMSGVETLKALMVLDPQARVVMISAMGQEAIVKDAVIAGAKAFIVKPFKEERVIKTLLKLMERG